jgi:N-methylhydantoinase A
VFFGPAGFHDTPVLTRGELTSRSFHGPLIIEEYDATTVVPPGCSAILDSLGNIVIDIAAETPSYSRD